MVVGFVARHVALRARSIAAAHHIHLRPIITHGRHTHVDLLFTSCPVMAMTLPSYLPTICGGSGTLRRFFQYTWRCNAARHRIHAAIHQTAPRSSACGLAACIHQNALVPLHPYRTARHGHRGRSRRYTVRRDSSGRAVAFVRPEGKRPQRDDAGPLNTAPGRPAFCRVTCKDLDQSPELGWRPGRTFGRGNSCFCVQTTLKKKLARLHRTVRLWHCALLFCFLARAPASSLPLRPATAPCTMVRTRPGHLVGNARLQRLGVN